MSHIPSGVPMLSPYLAYRDAAAAIAWYVTAFDATEKMRLKQPDGKIAHAEITIGDAMIMMADEQPKYNRTPESLGGFTVVLHLYVENTDEFFNRALAAGAKELIPVADQFYGDRSGRLQDPFGHVWIIATCQEELPVEEMQKRFDDLMSSE